MTLPTTRIDTLSPPGRHQDGETNCSDSSQQILLVDFVLNGNGGGVLGGSDGSSSGGPHQFQGHGAIPSTKILYPSSYQVPAKPMPVKQNNHVNYNNDLSNFTLVNLSNINEPDEGNHDEQDNEGLPMIPRRQTRSSISTSNKKENFYAYPTKEVSKSNKSSSLSSSDDSDTGFLVPHRSHNGIKGRKDECHYRLQKQSSLTPQSPDSPILTSSLHQGHRKRLKRKRSTVRKQFTRPQSIEGNDSFSMCCCFGEEDNRSESGNMSKYLRFICLIVIIIFIATFTSIMVSLQRKVDSLSLEVNKLTSAAGSNDFPSKTTESDQDKSNTSHPHIMDNLVAKQEQLNASFVSLQKQLEDLTQKVSTIEKQPSIDELRTDLARLGSEMKGSIEEMHKEIDSLKAKAEESSKKSNSDGGNSKSQLAQDSTLVPPSS